MSIADIMAEVDRMTDEERQMLSRRLRARELATDPERTTDMAARLDKMLSGQGRLSEEELRSLVHV